MAFDAGKRAGEGEATGAAVFVRVNVAWKVRSARSVYPMVRSYTDHIVHRELKSGSGMITLDIMLYQPKVHYIWFAYCVVVASHKFEKYDHRAEKIMECYS